VTTERNQGSSAIVYASCNALLDAQPDLADGVYLSQPEDSGDAFEVYCESVGHKFALGGETSYSERWYNCAGWPQHHINQGVVEMPSHFRFFFR